MAVKAAYYNLTLGIWISRAELPDVLTLGWAPFPLQHKGEIVVAPAGFLQLNPDATLFLDAVFTRDWQAYKRAHPGRG